MKTATGKVIRAFRKHFGYSQQFLAKEINVTTRVIENIENGKVSADVDKLHKLAQLFRIRDGIILDLAKEVLETKSDAWLAGAIRQIRSKPTDNDEDYMHVVIGQ